MKNKWIGNIPEICQICKTPFEESFIDGRIKVGSRWCLMCKECHQILGVGLGVGKGQEYDVVTLEKITRESG